MEETLTGWAPEDSWKKQASEPFLHSFLFFSSKNPAVRYESALTRRGKSGEFAALWWR